MSKNNLSLGLIQISSEQNKERNLEKLDRFLCEIEELPDILILPEYFGGLEKGEPQKNLVKKNAISIESDFINKVREKIRKLNTALIFTIYRKGNGKYFNSAIFLDESGEIKGVYDKIHLFDALGHRESEIFEKGKNVVTVDWKGHKIGIAICFDLRFPELFRILRNMEAEIVIIPSGWYSGPHKKEQWKTLIRARAHENNFFVVGVDQPKPHFVGNSMVASPLGYEVFSLGEDEEIETARIDIKEIQESKKKLPLNDLERDEIYNKYAK